MATIIREFEVEASPDDAWDAVRDVGAVHRRLCPAVLTDAWCEGDARIVVFADGPQVREVILSIDDVRRRLAYAAVGGRLAHHNSTIEVRAGRDGGSRLVWTTDLSPDGMQPAIEALVEAGVADMTASLSGAR